MSDETYDQTGQNQGRAEPPLIRLALPGIDAVPDAGARRSCSEIWRSTSGASSGTALKANRSSASPPNAVTPIVNERHATVLRAYRGVFTLQFTEGKRDRRHIRCRTTYAKNAPDVPSERNEPTANGVLTLKLEPNPINVSTTHVSANTTMPTARCTIAGHGSRGRVKTIRSDKRKPLAPNFFVFAKFARGVCG